jgi:hypothetical protein
VTRIHAQRALARHIAVRELDGAAIVDRPIVQAKCQSNTASRGLGASRPWSCACAGVENICPFDLQHAAHSDRLAMMLSW